jgi:hypothetical protein
MLKASRPRTLRVFLMLSDIPLWTSYRLLAIHGIRFETVYSREIGDHSDRNECQTHSVETRGNARLVGDDIVPPAAHAQGLNGLPVPR